MVEGAVFFTSTESRRWFQRPTRVMMSSLHDLRHSDKSVRVLRCASTSEPCPDVMPRPVSNLDTTWRRSAGAAPASPSKSTWYGRGKSGSTRVQAWGGFFWGSGESSVWGVWRTAVRTKLWHSDAASAAVPMICSIFMNWRFCQDRGGPGSSFGQSTLRRGRCAWARVKACLDEASR